MKYTEEDLERLDGEIMFTTLNTNIDKSSNVSIFYYDGGTDSTTHAHARAMIDKEYCEIFIINSEEMLRHLNDGTLRPSGIKASSIGEAILKRFQHANKD